MVVHNGDLTKITNQIAQAHGTGSTPWTGSAGITSSTAAAKPSMTALGVELNDDGTAAHNPLMTVFDGQTVTNTDVLVKYTFVGDADLSGTINAIDYALIDNGFNHRNDMVPPTGWRNGDFNYDGIVNGDDYTLIDNAYNTQGAVSFAGGSAGPAEMIASDSERVAGVSVAVPEPGSVVLLSFSVAGLLGKRRRRS